MFFLYFSSALPLDRVIQLSAVYYLSVFILEVPSGYFSDRIGRRTTLMLAALCLMLAHTCFIIGGRFELLAVGQLFLAAGIAMQSGTDTAFHYDSLAALGREGEYPRREAKAEQSGLTMLAVAALAGGLSGMIDLRLAYVFSLSGAVAMAAIVWLFVEPSRELHDEPRHRGSFWVVLHGCWRRLRDPVLAWVFFAVIVLYAMAHIVFEFYQPYIALLDIELFKGSENASLISGIVIAGSMFGGALAARVSVAWQARLGLVGLMACASVMQLGIVGSMALVVHSSVLVLVFARNFPMSLVHAPVRAAIAPRIGSGQRATYLSLQGLSERLVFAFLLFFLSAGLDADQGINATVLKGVLTQSAYLGLMATVVLFLFGPRIRRMLGESS